MNPYYRNGVATGVLGGFLMSSLAEGDFKAAGILAVITIGLFLYDYRRGFVGPIVCALLFALTLVSAHAQSDEIRVDEWPEDVPCDALMKNPDGSYTQIKPLDVHGIKMKGNIFAASDETRFWDQHCAGRTARMPEKLPSAAPDDTVPPRETQPAPPGGFPERPVQRERLPVADCKALSNRVSANLNLISGMMQQRFDSATPTERWCAAMQRRYDQLVEESTNLIESCLRDPERNRLTQRVLTTRTDADRQMGQRCSH